jgi:hypothetical protein
MLAERRNPTNARTAAAANGSPGTERIDAVTARPRKRAYRRDK